MVIATVNRLSLLAGGSSVKYSRTLAQLIAWLGALLLLFPQTVYAYLDPGSGSLMIQAVIAVFFAVSLAMKVYWRKIKVFITTLFSTGQKANEDK